MSLLGWVKRWWFKPLCPREQAGYNCHSYLPTGCETCGRGRPRK